MDNVQKYNIWALWMFIESRYINYRNVDGWYGVGGVWILIRGSG
jgi:hypothetical protein